MVLTFTAAVTPIIKLAITTREIAVINSVKVAGSRSTIVSKTGRF